MIETNRFQIMIPDILEVMPELKKGSNCTNNIHAQRDAQKPCFISPPPPTTLT